MDDIHEERNFQATSDVQIYDTWESMNLRPELIEHIKKLNYFSNFCYNCIKEGTSDISKVPSFPQKHII